MATASDQSAVDYFEGAYTLASLRRATESMLSGVDALLLPTAPTHFTISQVSADPISKNAVLGRFTNFMNLLDLCGIAIPAGALTNGCPFGITLAADRQHDEALLSAAQKILCRSPRQLGATGVITREPPLLPAVRETMPIAVCGAHLTGMPLNFQLQERGARLREQTKSAPNYHLYALPGGPTFRPGMVRNEQSGASIELEVFDMPLAQLGSFLQGITAPLGLGKIELESGEWVTGFICEPYGIIDAEDITKFGSWRSYVQSLKY
jgi:allophanate hydrolase